MNRAQGLCEKIVIVGLVVSTAGQTAIAQNGKLAPGGLSPLPVIQSITRDTNQTSRITITWTGFTGPYQVFSTTNLESGVWQASGKPTGDLSLTLAATNQTFYRVGGASPEFAGAQACAECHTVEPAQWPQTKHAQAFALLKAAGQQTNTALLPSHTVAYGLPTGFKSEAATPGLAGVQCENCHGPAGEHTAYFDDATLRPRITVSAELCGSCHQDYNAPFYDEWTSSGHALVVPATAAYFRQAGEPRIKTCGPCHSGAARLALLKGRPLPDGETAATTPITCAVCHDPHQKTANGAQLRNPLASTNFFSYNTNTSFAAQYNPQVSICGQCHNARGAQWQDTEGSPHYSPQYNMLLGNLGVLTAPAELSRHSSIELQCVQCHMHASTPDPVTPANPRQVGHYFAASTQSCAPCHSEASAEARIGITQTEIIQRLLSVKEMLDTWATTKAPAALQAKYGNLAWEYTTPGVLSNPGEDATIHGPDAQEQTQIPDEIKQARFNLYLVQQDGSYGVHNGKHARLLLRAAEEKVNTLLAKP